VLFDNGAGASPSGTVTPGDPYAGFEASFPSFPIPSTIARHWYLGAGGVLEDQPPTGETIDRFTWNAGALPLTDYTGSTGPGGLWGNAANWQWNWQPSPTGSAVSYLTAPLTADTTVIGAGAVHVWVRSSTPNVDLLATISEVRPDGMETFVQDGWVRGDERRLDPQKSTLLEPVLSLRVADVQPMPTGRFVKVVIPLYFEGHVYRAGSRVRLTIAAPNGSEPVWSFDKTSPTRTASQSIGLSPSMRSSLILPVVPGVNVPTSLPPCPSLRNEPCRPYVG
jgi:predicted acyl esterase